MTVPITTMGDRIVIIMASILVITLYGLYWHPLVAGSKVEYSSPEGHATLSLDQDRTLALNGPLGTSHIEIRNGRVRFLDSPCRHQYCVHSGWLHNKGDFAACLPNQITLLVKADRQATYDAVNY